MRIRHLVMISALMGAVASPAFAQTAEKYRLLSSELVTKAQHSLNAEKAHDAQMLYERALVANPANVDALIGLGRAHEAQGHVGSGLKYYRKALEIEPNDKDALEVQAIAFLKRNLAAKAEGNREKLARLCQAGCAELEAVDTAIEEYRAKQASADLANEG
ncbi:tetratricopeptide repeat protein [Kordiimonas aestuarii]|uniref:tetratricopeptide repeat protein n=1 Tax=Kordiimonas aestuarii TaxID=1005925 RepID=UPI0021D12FAD|nr:tetratricopeptide repeat protein [Kordiimonas aestuarii]